MPIYLSTNSIERLASKYYEKGIIVDTNLLLLLLVGAFDKSRIATFKRTATYSEEDYELVYKLALLFKKVFVTPQILAELSNLLKVSEAEESEMLRAMISTLEGSTEKHFSKNHLILNPLLIKLGFTDVSILSAARNKRVLVITDDLPLSNALRESMCDVLNINDIRTTQWLI